MSGSGGGGLYSEVHIAMFQHVWRQNWVRVQREQGPVHVGLGPGSCKRDPPPHVDRMTDSQT